MAALNYTTLESTILGLLPDNNTQQVSAADIRACMTHINDSHRERAAAVTGSIVDDIDIPSGEGSAAKLGTFGTPVVSGVFDAGFVFDDQAIMTADAANDRLTVLKSGIFTFTLAFAGQWAANNALTLELRIGGQQIAPARIFTADEGGGTSDPHPLSISVRSFSVTEAMLPAQIEIYGHGDSAFTLDQIDITMSVGYIPMTLGTVG